VSPSATVCGSPAPTRPTAVRPVLTPTLTAKSVMFQAAAMSREYSPTTSTIRSAARAPRSWSSSWTLGTPK
jgi:hypothetical protein